MSRCQLLSDDQWALIEDLLPVPTGKRGRPFRDDRPVVEGIIYRYRCGNRWCDVSEVFGPWQTIWAWHRRMNADGTWDAVLTRLLSATQAGGIIDWSVALDFTIAHAHQHATNLTRPTADWSIYTNPVFEHLLAHLRVPRLGGGPTHTRSDRVRGDSATVRSDRPPPTQRVTRRPATGRRRCRLQGPQRDRARLQHHPAVARTGHPQRHTPRRLRSRGPTRHHPLAAAYVRHALAEVAR